MFAIATTGSSFGTAGSTQVVDANGAGISGTFTTSSSSFPSGNGLAGSTFDFFFDVLPGNGNQNGLNNSVTSGVAKSLLNQHTTQSNYNPYYDYNGAGVINTVDSALETAPTPTIASRRSPRRPRLRAQLAGGGSVGFTALALGVQESGSTSSSSSGEQPVRAAQHEFRQLALGSDQNVEHRRHLDVGRQSGTAATFAATDEAVSDFDLADLWI